MKIGFIGTGNMAKALIIGGLTAFESENIYVSNRTREKAENLAKEHNLNLCENNIEVVNTCDIIFLCVKPNMYADVLAEIRDFIKGKVLISIAAGPTMNFLYNQTKGDCVFVRTMPNTPSQVLCGVTGIHFDDKISENYKQVVEKFFKSVGEVVLVKEEQIDLVIGSAGSSPAYAYMFIDAIATAVTNLGLDYESALKLSANAVMGAGKMILETGISPKTLTNNVCSPGGSTIEGVKVLEGNIEELMNKTVNAVINKSKLMKID